MARTKLPGGADGLPAFQLKFGRSTTRRGGPCRTKARYSLTRDNSMTMRTLSGWVPIRTELMLSWFWAKPPWPKRPAKARAVKKTARKRDTIDSVNPLDAYQDTDMKAERNV